MQIENFYWSILSQKNGSELKFNKFYFPQAMQNKDQNELSIEKQYSQDLPLGPRLNQQIIQARKEYFELLSQKYYQNIKSQAPKDIQIVLPDGKIFEGLSYSLKPIDILQKSLSPNEAKNILAVKVFYSKEQIEKVLSLDDDDIKFKGKDFQIYDLERPFEDNCKLEFVSFKEDLGKHIFWHSSAHILGAILEQVFGGYLCIGPPVESGFYYDIYLGDQVLSPAQFSLVEKKIEEYIKQDHKFERLILSKADALELFKSNPFKVQLINQKVKENDQVSAYRCGSFVDLCQGPHIPSFSHVKSFKILKVASAYWLGDKNNASLQRVYGISFPNSDEMKEYLDWSENVESLDHKNIGQSQGLFFFHQLSPGSAFYYPNGAKIYNKLISLIRKEYMARNYQEVISPCIFSSELWKISGHLEKFKDSMFKMMVEKQEFGLKPMNCPGHCLIFDSLPRSYRELPIRMADFGVLHRNEISGALHGLVRCRKFQQDDSHIFCRLDQVMEEMMSVFDFMKYVYGLFDLEYKLVMSSRPENALGEKEMWDKGEEILKNALEKFGAPWELAEGDGAFYGPKIEVHLRDARKRWFQCATIQIDFVLPQRFRLQYRSGEAPDPPNKNEGDEKAKNEKSKVSENESQNEDYLKPGFQRPVILHRAVLGSIERFYALICEKLAGKWPFWLSPRQVKVIAVSEKSQVYAEKVYYRLKYEGFEAELDESNLSLQKKIRNAHVENYNFAMVVGPEEEKSASVDLRDIRAEKRMGRLGINEAVVVLKKAELPLSPSFLNLREKCLFGFNVKQLWMFNLQEKISPIDDGKNVNLVSSEEEISKQKKLNY